ncbi:hypothetical protein [Achromobacter pestifer]|uniref:hypothetical protein n=1 Tax=Achromobacter pestifer TaxID=1353889 RepID=UPI001C2EC3FA|nr:hypothetical protein [Achromobacter pestifer]
MLLLAKPDWRFGEGAVGGFWLRACGLALQVRDPGFNRFNAVGCEAAWVVKVAPIGRGFLNGAGICVLALWVFANQAGVRGAALGCLWGAPGTAEVLRAICCLLLLLLLVALFFQPLPFILKCGGEKKDLNQRYYR